MNKKLKTIEKLRNGYDDKLEKLMKSHTKRTDKLQKKVGDRLLDRIVEMQEEQT